MTEIEWKDTEGFEGYQVSNHGGVRSRRRGGVWKDLSTYPSEKGYMKVGLYLKFVPGSPKKQKQVFVHVLVARAFVEGYAEGLEVNHKDGLKPNCTSSNLEWATKVQNAQHSKTVLGNDPHRVLRKPVVLVEIVSGEETSFRSISEAAICRSLDTSSLCGVLSGRFSQTKGFSARFAEA